MSTSGDFDEEGPEDAAPTDERLVWSETEQFRPWMLSHLQRQFSPSLTAEDLEDALQDALLEFWQYRSRAAEIRSPLGLLASIARRRALDRLRQRTGHRFEGLP